MNIELERNGHKEGTLIESDEFWALAQNSPHPSNGEVSFGRKEKSEPEKRLEEIRELSNVIQALENLINQCGENEVFYGLKNFSENAASELKLKMRRSIHSQ